MLSKIPPLSLFCCRAVTTTHLIHRFIINLPIHTCFTILIDHHNKFNQENSKNQYTIYTYIEKNHSIHIISVIFDQL